MTIERRHIWLGIGILILIPILVPLITLHRTQARVLRALNQDLGRSIHVDAVHLRLFPLPGVELDGVRVGEDPAFGAEDMVIADDATAAVRLTSLLAGHLVFSRIHLDRPSINLVRNEAGQWNITALLNRTGKTGPDAPRPGTPRALPPSVRFPYIEWSDARINFKFHQAKTRFYLDQVQGSLARESDGWRLQASFQPQRSDLSLSDTGQVTLDGRWPATAAAGFHQRPFDMVLRLQNSYLAGSSALFVGHDAGVHGILTAQAHVQGSGQQFEIVGTLQAQALRRWDLLPPPATVAASFAAVYTPGQDRLDVTGIGDPGFHHLRLSGEVDNLFNSPSAALELELHQFAAADLIPLALAVKAHLPAHLQALGTADGNAHLVWSAHAGAGTGHFGGNAELTLAQFRLRADQDQLTVPAATVTWDGRRLRLGPNTAATVAAAGMATPAPMVLNAGVDDSGFQASFASPRFGARAAAAFTRLLGMRSPWPPGLDGTAQVRLGVASSWSGFRHAGWQGTAELPVARFHPPGGDFALTRVGVVFADPQPVRVSFTTALPAALPITSAAPAGTVTGTLQWSATDPPQFDLHAASLRDTTLWRLLHPPPQGLEQRVFGDVTPAWITGLHAQGSLAIADLDWQGIHTGVKMRLVASPQLWSAPSLTLALAHGEFDGRGSFSGGAYRVDGQVRAGHALRVADLLAPTGFQGLLSGSLSGSLHLVRPLAATGLAAVDASGDFDLGRGQLATRSGDVSFRRFTGKFDLHQGHAQLGNVVWVADGVRWEGKGTAEFDAHGLAGFDLQLANHNRHLRLRGKPR